MPRYFFNLLHPDRDAVSDDEGLVFEDDTVARREGMASLGELMKEACSSYPVPTSVCVQIVREGGGIIDLLTGQLCTEPQNLDFRQRPSYPFTRPAAAANETHLGVRGVELPKVGYSFGLVSYFPLF
jgi:hypothetical protein